MARLPVVGGDSGNWGTILNDFLEVSLNQDGTIQPGAVVQAGGVTSVNTVTPNASGNVTLTAASVGALSSTASAGGDLAGSYPNPTVAKVNGVSVSGTSSAGQVLTAGSSSAASWASIQASQLPSSVSSASTAYAAGNVLESPASIDICRAYGVAPGDDVTTAIQDALNALATAGTGGEVVISIPGTYTIDGSLQSATVLGYTYNGQILIPAVSPSDTTSLALTIRGMVPPMGGGEGRPSGGGVTLVSNATAGWVFDCIPANQAFSAPNPWTNVMLTFENLILELSSNPQCGAVNALCCLQLRGRDFYVQTSFDGEQTLTGTNEAVVIPGWESEGMNVFDRCEFRNVPIAFRFGEHMLLNWVGVYYANVVFNCPTTNTGHGLFLNELDIGNCKVIFNATEDLSDNPVKVYGTLDYEGPVVPMTAFVSQPNPTNDNGSFVGSLKVHSVTGGGFPLALGSAGIANLLGRLEIVNVGGFRDQSWKTIHPQDTFARTYSPMTTGAPGLSNPSFHPWSLFQGTFKVTSGTGLTSTYSGNAIALIPAKENGVSRLVEATFVLPSSGYNCALVSSFCHEGTNSGNWIGAHISGSGSVALVTGAYAAVTVLATASGVVSGGGTHTIGVEVINGALGIPAWVALYVDGAKELTWGLSAAQQSALTFQTGNGSPPFTPGGFASVMDGLVFYSDQVTAVTWFTAQDAVPPLPSVTSGTVSLVAGTVTVANSEITSNSILRLNRQTAGGTLGELSASLTAGTSFTIQSASSTETSAIYYEIVSY